MDGRNKQTSVDKQKGGINMVYKTRYQACKHASGAQVTIRVDGGYVNMDARQYNVWRRQK